MLEIVLADVRAHLPMNQRTVALRGMRPRFGLKRGKLLQLLENHSLSAGNSFIVG